MKVNILILLMHIKIVLNYLNGRLENQKYSNGLSHKQNQIKTLFMKKMSSIPTYQQNGAGDGELHPAKLTHLKIHNKTNKIDIHNKWWPFSLS